MFNWFSKKHSKSDARNLQKQLDAVQVISSLLISGSPLYELLSKVTQSIPSVLGVSLVAILIWNEEKKEFTIAKVSLPTTITKIAEKALHKEVENAKYPIKETENIFFQSIKNKEIAILKNTSMQSILTPLMSELYADILVNLVKSRVKLLISSPMIVGGNALGVIALGWNQQEFNDHDRNLVTTFTNQAAVGIYNSNLFKQVQSQIDDLEKRNKQLEIINKFTNKIITTLDVEKVAQTALDSITDILGYLGATYAQVNTQERSLQVIAYTRNHYSDIALGLLDKKIQDYRQYIDDPDIQDTINVTAFRGDKITVTNDFKQFGKKAIPGTVSAAIQKALSVKSIVAVPVKSKNQVVGIIDFIIANKSPEEITQLELDTMSIISNQIGIALDNANLYQKTQKALTELEQLYQKNREMLDILGHELRTPAVITKGNLELVLKQLKDEQLQPQELILKIRTKVQAAYEGIIKEAGLITSLLSATKLDSGQLVIINETVDLYDIAKSTYQNYIDIAAKQNLELRFIEPTNKIPTTVGDSIRLAEVIDNLISNAIKYTKEGFVEIFLTSDKNYIYLHIKDTGNGISKEEMSGLFHKFHRLNNYLGKSQNIVRPGGTGLGLYVAKGIIDAHEGKIWVVSKGIGEGSIFSFSIPLRDLNQVATTENITGELDMIAKMNQDQVITSNS